MVSIQAEGNTGPVGLTTLSSAEAARVGYALLRAAATADQLQLFALENSRNDPPRPRAWNPPPRTVKPAGSRP